MTNEDRDKLRDKQDRVLAIAARRGRSDVALLTEQAFGSPTVGQLRHCLWPDYEWVMDQILQDHEANQ